MWHKSDKSTNYSSVNKRQLSVYRRMLSVLKGVPEDRISTAIIYLALRGGINTGRFGLEVDDSAPSKTAFSTFEKHLRKVLEWKDDPRKFVQEILDNPQNDMLYEAVAEQLRGR